MLTGKRYTGDPQLDLMFEVVEFSSQVDFCEIRKMCDTQNRVYGRYDEHLRSRLARIRRCLFGKDEYEQFTSAQPRGLNGWTIDCSTGLNLPYEVKKELSKAIRSYCQVDEDRDKDGFWKSFGKGLCCLLCEQSYRRK